MGSVALLCLGWTQIAGSADRAGRLDPEGPARAAPSAAPDPALVALRANLESLLGGRLPETIAVPTLFEIPLHDLERVRQRVEQLRAQLPEADRGELSGRTLGEATPGEPAGVADPARTAESAADAGRDLAEAGVADALAGRRDDSGIAAATAQIGASELRRDIARARLAYLERLEQRLANMTEASRRILPSLGKSRAALDTRAESLGEMARETRALAERLAAIGERSAGGMLVGFVAEQRAIARELSVDAASYLGRADRLEALAADLASLSATLRAEGDRVRAIFYRSLAGSDESARIDEMFLSHLKTQRRLRKSTSDLSGISGQQELEGLAARIRALATRPLAIATTQDGRDLVDRSAEILLPLEDLVSSEAAGLPAWQLAFENELVTVLSEQASAAVRSAAYGFSSELVDDVTSEARLAWERVVDSLRKLRADFPTLAAFSGSARGQALMLRTAGVLAVFAIWLMLRRVTATATVRLVRRLSGLRIMRRRIGRLVRWSGLIQSILPSLVALIALEIALSIMGRDQAIAQALRVVLSAGIYYVLGRQLLIGSTQRITPGRPALIRVAFDTRERLYGTYANLGIVVAIAYVLDGLARIVIGAGRIVSIVDTLLVLWLFVWGLWEAIRWRLPLARSWRQLLPDQSDQADPTGIEARVAAWMEANRVGFVLSPVAGLRLIARQIWRAASSRATGTSLAQSVRAKILRRRSKQLDSATTESEQLLPDEYLEAFPLYPILGEDDSLLVSRDSLLQEMTDQWRRWKETRADGSLALVGEKGAGKTTLAAQLARRLRDTHVVEHSLRGKPRAEAELIEALSAALGFEGLRSVEELTAELCAGEDRVIILDEVHNVFLRDVGGYRAYDALVDLVNATTSRVFWVVIINNFTWQFLNNSRGRAHYFRKILVVPGWSAEEIESLIRLRNQRTGYELRFTEVLLSESSSSGRDLALVEEPDGYFRLLWESSGGNPRVATHLWLSSLRPVGEKTLSVGLFAEASTDGLSALQDELVFSLAAVCQHENLSPEELSLVLNLPDGFAGFAMRFLIESGFVTAKDDRAERFTIAPLYYRAVLRVLRNKHLLFD